MRKLIAFVLLLSIAGVARPAAAQTQLDPSPRREPQETLIRNATVLTVSHGTLQNADLLLRKGKIAAVGQNLKASPEARVIDATGKFVMPGIIDCHSHSMLDAINELT
ncbi:MAG TPA: hypothetical protein VEV81_01250, partial [Pyrinomonadaceae bacterium]|nr:hypothetical protein [Pyrinomonadaceae bacterium]